MLFLVGGWAFAELGGAKLVAGLFFGEACGVNFGFFGLKIF